MMLTAKSNFVRYALLATILFCGAQLPASAALKIEVVSQIEGSALELNNAVVWASPTDGANALTTNTQSISVEMEQRRRQFNPYILPVQVGVPVSFPNRDDTSHHVYSFSKSHTFEIPLYKKQLPKPITFREPGIVPLGCNIHDWMIAYVVVVDTPYFAQLHHSEQVLEQLPPGTYEINLWHPAIDGRELTSQLVTYTGTDSTLYFNLRYPLKNASQPTAPGTRNDELEDY